MNVPFTLLRRELMAFPRRKRFYLKRCTFIALGGIVILWGIWFSHQTRTTTVGLMIFRSLAMSTLAAMSLISVVTSSGVIMREKEERTLGLLFLTDLSSWGVIIGKFLTGFFSTLMTILSTLPMFMLAVSLGGVSARQILAALAVVLSTIFLGTCMGLFVSSAANTEKTANGLVALFCIGFFVILPIAVSAEPLMHSRTPGPGLLCVISPFLAMGSLINGRMLLFGMLNCCLSLAFGILLLLLARLVLPRRVVSKERPSVSQALKQQMRSVRGVRNWVLPTRIIGNPVTWKDMHYYHGGMIATWFKFFISTGAVALIVLMVGLRTAGRDPEAVANVLLSVTLIFCAAVFGVGSLSHFGMAFNRERKSRALEMLLTTSLSDREIIFGKIKAALLSAFPWLVGALFCSFVVVGKFGAERGFWQSAFACLSEYAGMWFGYSALALWLSLRFRKNIAFGVCLLLALIWNTLGRGVVLSLIVGVGGFAYMFVMDFAVHVALGVVCLSLVFSSLRRIALADAE